MRLPDPRPEQAQVVVDLGHRADGRPRVARGRLLVDRDRRREPVDRVDVGLLHQAEELARVGGERLDVAALPLGVDRVEGKARLAGAGEAGDHDQGVARQLEVDVLEVVLARPGDDYSLGRGHYIECTRANGCSRGGRRIEAVTAEPGRAERDEAARETHRQAQVRAGLGHRDARRAVAESRPDDDRREHPAGGLDRGSRGRQGIEQQVDHRDGGREGDAAQRHQRKGRTHGRHRDQRHHAEREDERDGRQPVPGGTLANSRAPNQRPPATLPTAWIATRVPPSSAAPCSDAKAVMEISMAPTMIPTPSAAPINTRTPGSAADPTVARAPEPLATRATPPSRRRPRCRAG